MHFKFLIAAVAALGLTACNTTMESGAADPAFGEAIKYDMAIQVIDPDPVYDEASAQAGDSGVKGAEAVKRYRTGRVKDAKAVTTSDAGGGVAPQ